MMLESFVNTAYLSQQDLDVIAQAGYRERGASTFSSRGTVDNPVLIIVDMQTLFVGADVPILEAVATAPTMIGERGWRAIEQMLPLIGAARDAQIPVIYGLMQPRNRQADDPLLNVVAPLKPQPQDTVITKTTSSIFFNTDLPQRLHDSSCDSVILIGNSTSGCIRAAAVDAVQHGFTAIVPHNCVFDRIEASHHISLLDMWMKYAIVESSQQVIERLVQINAKVRP